ncbi:MAG: hypothetical protein HQ510_01230 [Candidatus Marinimicrobia bacterium]|nr:hypothetical protein [Candidatus Neomarinimicrobiota bacterium]
MEVYNINKIVPDPKHLSLINQMAAKTEGMIAVTGWEGSGKTSTLVSIAGVVAESGRTINVIYPDNSEISEQLPDRENLPGTWNLFKTDESSEALQKTLQTITNPDEALLFLGLDEAWIKAALDRAIQGYLTLINFNCAPFGDGAETMYVNGVLNALHKMGMSTADIAAGLAGISTQKLVPKLCKHCRTLSTGALSELQQLFPEAANLQKMWVAPGTPECKKCNKIGLLGRFAIYEQLVINEPEQEQIRQYLDSGKEPSWNSQIFMPFTDSVLYNIEAGNLGLDMFKSQVHELL